MSKLNYHGKIVVLKRDYPVSEIIDSIINMPCHEVRGFFQKIGLTVPKALRMKVLKEVLQEPVEKTIEERLNLADELGYRLSYFDRFSEYQLENLLKFYNSVSLNRKYLTELWLHLFMYMMEHKVSEKEIDLLIQDAKKHSEITEDILAYNFELRKVFHDEKDHIDGLSADDFRVVLYHASTINEIRDIGKKYDVNVPRRLKKEQLADIIVAELKERGELPAEEEAKIRGLSIVLMQRYAKDHNVKASIELKKEEVIEYILANAEETKASYNVPDASIYVKEVEERPKPQPKPQPAPAPKPEPAPVEVKEEPKVVEKVKVVEEKVDVVKKHSPEYEEVLKELALLREELMDHLAKCNCTKNKKEA